MTVFAPEFDVVKKSAIPHEIGNDKIKRVIVKNLMNFNHSWMLYFL